MSSSDNPPGQVLLFASYLQRKKLGKKGYPPAQDTRPPSRPSYTRDGGASHEVDILVLRESVYQLTRELEALRGYVLRLVQALARERTDHK